MAPSPQISVPAGEQTLADTSDTAGLVTSIVSNWNSRKWAAAANGLDELARTGQSTANVDQRMVRHLRAICASFHGQYTVAMKIFEAELESLCIQDEDYVPDDLEISAAHWLGDTCLILRKLDDAALAWSIAWEGASVNEERLKAQQERLLIGLRFIQNGSLQGDVLSRRTLGELSDALANRDKTTIKTFRTMPLNRKADYIGSVVEHCVKKESPDADIPSFGERASDFQITTDTFRHPSSATTLGKLQFDPFLLLDPRKFRYIAAWGLDINYAQLDLRFWPNLHQEYQFFSKVPVTSVYSTRKRSLKWIVHSLETELNARGMLVAHYFDRMKVIRVRNFGFMDYVAAFVIVFIRTPLYTVFGVQVPNHLVRTGWETIHGPQMKARNRVVHEVKEILVNAEQKYLENKSFYQDVFPGSRPAPTFVRPDYNANIAMNEDVVAKDAVHHTGLNEKMAQPVAVS